MAGKAYEQVADALHRQVVTGELEPGSRLPTEVELASGFGVSRATVREALRLLAAQSLMEGIPLVTNDRCFGEFPISTLW